MERLSVACGGAVVGLVLVLTGWSTEPQVFEYATFYVGSEGEWLRMPDGTVFQRTPREDGRAPTVDLPRFLGISESKASLNEYLNAMGRQGGRLAESGPAPVFKGSSPVFAYIFERTR